MYAVGKVGSLISRSVYTVSGPFHPFGGAVDIVVVQQQDGSFKSSPWYVRFGKFQGILKSREKVVNISLNGVEAGFHMYLDSNGEAYFLRNADPDGEDGEFVVSPASSGDEREAPIQEAQLRKSKSTSCDSSTMEADVGEGKILARTTSRRTTILERMFGRKTVKNNVHAVDRVSSLERAEIAAELLDSKWSTNLPRSSKPHSSNDESSKSKLAEASNSNQMETTKTVLPEHSLDHGKETDSNCNSCSPRGGRNSLEDETDQCLQTTSVKEEVVEIHTRETSDFTDMIISTVHQPGSESFSNDVGTDKSLHESVDTQGELLHNLQDVAGREIHTKEALSNGVLEIHTFDTGTTSGKSEVVSQFVSVDSYGANQNLTGSNSPACAITDEKHEVALIPSAQDPVQEKVVILSSSETLEISQDSVQEKMVIFSSSETLESSYAVSNISDDKAHDASDISLADSVQREEHSGVFDGSKEQVFSEERSSAFCGASSNKKDVIEVVVEEHGAFILEDPAPQILQGNGPDMDISVNSVSLSHTDGVHDFTCQHDVVCPDDSSSVVETSSYVPDDDPQDLTKNVIVENQACNRELDVSVTQTSTIGDESTESNVQSANFPNKIEVVSSPTATGSSSFVSDPEDVAQNLIEENKACSREPCVSFTLTSTIGDEPTGCIAQSANFPDKMEIEGSQTVTGSSSLVSDPEDVTESLFVENKACSRELDVSVTQTSTIGDESTESNVQSANFPNKIEVVSSPTATGSSSFVSDPEDVAQNLIDESKVCSREPCVSFTLTSTIGDEPTECIAQSTNFPDKMETEGSQTFTGSPSLVNDPEDVTESLIVENKACSREPDVSVTLTSTIEDGSTEVVAQSADFSNKIEVEEGSPTATGSSNLVYGEGETGRPSSVSGDEVGFVLEATAEPEEEAEARVSFSEYTEEIQFQFSDTENFADRKTMDDVVADKTAGEGEREESDCDTEKQEEGDLDLANELENCSDSLRPATSPVSIPTCNLQLEDNTMEAKSLPNLRSHIHDLERSDSFKLSRSLQPIAENNGVDPVKSTNSSFLEQKPEVAGDSEENSSPPEVTSNVVPGDNHADNVKIDSFVPFAELSLCRHLLSEGMGEDAARSAFDSEKVTLEKFHTMKQSLMRNNKLVVRIAGRYFPWDAAAPIVLGLISFSEEQVFEPKGMIKVERVESSAAPGGSWRIWPFSFRRTRTISAVQPVCEGTVETSVSTRVKESTPFSESDRERNKSRAKRIERKVRSLTPTSDELVSLDLREGRNVVTFTFSTAIVGKQQVDCHIYLWKWNTRIVISDVDGTITKSDVLGQFMPLVGVDWSQNGVAHLFSAIKENGYQLLFLSARAISQAHITRQFLFNLKQDGKALPDGPVVISPDGLFPSLYREVIRRAPHEFKISCLEAIKDLFPRDSNPFYAGFGNRDTDELSYLKVGIPMGKIFIINPKGEVAVNRRVDTKSYTSLHALVHGMFPTISSSSEQEDYNTWNYWKMPLPDVDL